MTIQTNSVDCLREERRGSVAVLTMNRPKRLNALSDELGEKLRCALARVADDDAVAAVVLTGAGKAFSSGADLNDAPGPGAEHRMTELWNPLIVDIRNCAIPVIAAVNGVAAGAGASLAFACDLRIADASARFQLSFVKIGLIPDVGATWLLPRLVGIGRANELALSGRDLPADEAFSWGLVNKVVQDGQSLDAAIALGEQLANQSRLGAGSTKRALREGLDRELEDQLDHEVALQAELLRGPDFAEAVRAFGEKRAPVFSRGGNH